MADIQIVKYKLRRGTDLQRQHVVLDQGEIIYTTDTKRVFVGSGTLSGGNVVGNKIHNPLTNTYSLTSTNAQVGDLVYAKNIFYQLTATDYTNVDNWKRIGASLDSRNLGYDASNNIYIKSGSISAEQLDSTNFANGLIIDSGKLQIDFNSSQLELSGNKLSIKNGGIGETQIASSSLGDGLDGGSGTTLSVKYDGDYFYIDGSGALSLSAIPSSSITFAAIDSDWIGDGLVYDGINSQIKSVFTNLDTNTLSIDLSGTVGLRDYGSSATNEMAKIQCDDYGIVLSNQNAIYDSVSCLSATNGGPLSALFNGTSNQVLSGSLPNIPLTTFTAISSNSSGSTVLQLSSAGFIMFEGETSARQDGKHIGRYAIPIFSY